MTTIKNNLAVLLLGFVLQVQMASAVTNVVLPGESIQAKINISSNGDTVAIFGGTYNEDLVITQAVRLAEVSGQDVIINGSLLISGVTDAPSLEGFAIGSSGRGLTISNTPSILLKNLNLTGGSGLFANGITNLQIQDSQSSALSVTGTTVHIVGTSVSGNLILTAQRTILNDSTISGNYNQNTGYLFSSDAQIGNLTSAANCTSILFRCNLGQAALNGAINIISYSLIGSYNSNASNSIHKLVGCRINQGRARVTGVSINGGGNNLLIANCDLRATGFNNGSGVCSGTWASKGIVLSATNNTGYIINNYIDGPGAFACDERTRDENTAIFSAGTGVSIINTIITKKSRGINAPFGTKAFGNYNYTVTTAYYGGVVPTEAYSSDPKYDTASYALLTNSPCIDGGTTDPRYRDRDGSRADAGPTGGAWFDPSGWTSDVPVVVSFDLSTDQYLEGTLAEIVLSGGHAVSVP